MFYLTCHSRCVKLNFVHSISLKRMYSISHVILDSSFELILWLQCSSIVQAFPVTYCSRCVKLTFVLSVGCSSRCVKQTFAQRCSLTLSAFHLPCHRLHLKPKFVRVSSLRMDVSPLSCHCSCVSLNFVSTCSLKLSAFSLQHAISGVLKGVFSRLQCNTGYIPYPMHFYLC